MNINIENFRNVLKKSTLNFSLDSVQLNISKHRVKSKMTTNSNDVITILDIDNNIMSLPEKMVDEYQFNFQEPNQNIIPYLSLIEDGQTTEIDIRPEKIVLKTGNQKSNLFFCSPQVVSVFTRDGVRSDVKYFTSMGISDELYKQFMMIKKIGMRFGKIYFSITKSMLSMEATDKTNRFSNGLKFDMYEVEGMPDMTLCFDYKNFVNVLSAIGDEYNDFIVNLSYVKEANLGMIFMGKGDETEKYYIMSRQDV